MAFSTSRLLVAGSTLALGASASGQTMLFDFGNTGQQTLSPGWNNVTYPNPDPAPTLFVVFDDTGAIVPGVTLEIPDQFFINGPPSQLGTESPSGDAAAYPVSATDDYFFGHTGDFAGGPDNPTGGIKITGLDQSLTYDFTFMSSRTGVNDSRETAYSVTGANSADGLLEASNNDTEVLSITGIFPDANDEIYIEVSAGPNNTNGNSFYYINLMQVDAVPEPASLGLLGASGLMLLRRRRA